MKRQFNKRFAAAWPRLCIFLLGPLAVSLLVGCGNEPFETDPYDREPVLTAYIDTDTPMSTVRFEWTGTFTGYYSRETFGIRQAGIVIYPLLDSAGQPVDSGGAAVYFQDVPDTAGLYRAVNPQVHHPRAGYCYRIEAFHEDLADTVWAVTTVPDTFSLQVTNYPDLTPPQSTIPQLTRNDPVLDLTWTPSSYAGGYLFANICLIERDSLQFLDAEHDTSDDDGILDQYFQYPLRADENELRVPWLWFVWRGVYVVDLMAVSPEYYRYVFTQQGQDSNTSPPRIESNIHNGLGIFGATSLQQFILQMEPVGG
jgi:hypothetical protein